MNKTKTAIIMGGAMGYKNGGKSIGGAIAIQLAKDGFQVIVVDELLPAGQWTVDKIKEAGGEAIFIQADVTDSEQIKNVYKIAIEKYGSINCLVNCVARYNPDMMKNVEEIEEDEWYKTLNVNLNAYFKCAKYALSYLKKSRGTIINISSIESFICLQNFAVYSISKAAVDAFTRSLAIDFGYYLRTNSIAPGFVKIANSENGRTEQELKNWYSDIAKTYPLQRVCEVEEIANVASFLASEKASYINGQTIVVDGGHTIWDKHQF